MRSKGLIWAFLTGGRGLWSLVRWALAAVVAGGVLVADARAVLAGAVVYGVLRMRPDAPAAWAAALVLGLLGWLLGAWEGPILGAAAGAVYWRADQAFREAQPVAGPGEAKRRQGNEAGRRLRTTHRVQGWAFGRALPGPLAAVFAFAAVPLAVSAGPVLGVMLAGDLPWPRARHRRELVVLPTSIPHVVVLGATREGKSEIVFRITEAAVEDLGQRVIYLNAKQPKPGAEPSVRLAALAEASGRSWRALVRDVGPWDAMRGTPERVRQRLLATEEWTEPYYRHVSNLLLGLALDLRAERGKPLETLPDLVWSLAASELAQLAKTRPDARAILDMMSRADVGGAVMRWASQCLMLRGWVGPGAAGGWSWEDADVIGVDLPTGTDPDAARMLLRAMLTDLEGWITDASRRPVRSDGAFMPVTLVIEEVSALDADPVIARRLVNLVERAAGAGVRCVIVAQGPSGLGGDREIEALLTNGAVITCRQTDKAAVERLAGLAGTEQRAEASAAYTGVLADRTGHEGSIRMQETYRVSPNQLRQLGTGEAVVIHSGRWAWLAVAMSEAGYGRPASEKADRLAALLGQQREALPPTSVLDEIERRGWDGNPS